MRKQEAVKFVENTVSRVRPNSNRVIIAVYVESPRKQLHQKIDLTNKATANPLLKRPKSKRTQGYNRRAELLAYSRELREGGLQQDWQPKRNSRPKFSMWKLSTASVKIQAPFRRIFRQFSRRNKFRYERIPSEKYSEVGEFSRRRKRKGPKRHVASSCCRKLKHTIKELSRGMRCSKGC